MRRSGPTAQRLDFVGGRTSASPLLGVFILSESINTLAFDHLSRVNTHVMYRVWALPMFPRVTVNVLYHSRHSATTRSTAIAFKRRKYSRNTTTSSAANHSPHTVGFDKAANAT